jgi:hypothetical protein
MFEIWVFTCRTFLQVVSGKKEINAMRSAVRFVVAMMLYVAAPTSAQAQTWDSFLNAIQKVETGSQKDPNNAVGDNGKALGAYQIWYSYWLDAVEHHPELKACGYEAVRDPAYARAIVMAYMARYAPKDATWENLARIHNGGPKGYRKAATAKYWTKVQTALKEAE